MDSYREWPNFECEQSINFVQFEHVIKTARDIILTSHQDLQQMKRKFMEFGYTCWNEKFATSQTLIISNVKVYVIFVEGFLSCCDFNLICNLFDINIYLNATKDLCLKRRSQRDAKRDVSNVSKEFILWFNELVWPFHELYRTRQLSNIIKSGKPFLCVNSNDDIEEIQQKNKEKLLDKVSTFIKGLLKHKGGEDSLHCCRYPTRDGETSHCDHQFAETNKMIINPLLHHNLPEWFDVNMNHEQSEKELEQFLFSHHVK